MSAIAPTRPKAPPGVPDWVPRRIRRMSVEEYEAAVASGAIPTSHRTHLINGYLVEKMPQNPPHVTAAHRCRVRLEGVLPRRGWHIRSGAPIRLPDRASEPEPDHCIVRGTIDDYLVRHPGAADIALVVEIADSSLADDHDYALNLYGPAGIPACWIVDVNARRVEVYTLADPQGYGPPEFFGEGQSIPVVIGGRVRGRIAVEDILPPHRPKAKAKGNRA